MKNKLKLAFLLGLITLVFGVGENVSAQNNNVPMVGGFKAVSVKDKAVVDAARFAVNSIAKSEEMELTLESIEQAERQVVAGTKYRLSLLLTYADGGELYPLCITAVVFRNLKNVYSLTEWDSQVCPEVE